MGSVIRQHAPRRPFPKAAGQARSDCREGPRPHSIQGNLNMAYAEDISEEERARYRRMFEDSAQQRSDDYKSWSDPVTLPEGLSPVFPFDVAMLPDSIGPWVVDISERLQSKKRFKLARFRQWSRTLL